MAERSFLETLAWPLVWAVEWVLVAFHKLFTWIGMAPASGWTWTLSIVGLVVVIRILLIPLFFKQIQSSRRMQLIQPELQKIQAKYKGRKDPDSQQRMSEETMDLYKRTGTNPFSSCLPILVQMPIFIVLFRVLNNLGAIAAGTHRSAGPLTPELAAQADSSTLFGAALSDTFMFTDNVQTKIFTMILIVLMSLTMFITQRQITMKNMPDTAMDNPMMKQQKMMMYLFPIIFAVTGVNFPIGVLLYWLVTNVWSMGQQWYVIRRMPTPGSEAEKAMQERRKRRGKAPLETPIVTTKDGSASEGPIPGELPTQTGGGQRQQPKRKPRRKRRK